MKQMLARNAKWSRDDWTSELECDNIIHAHTHSHMFTEPLINQHVVNNWGKKRSSKKNVFDLMTMKTKKKYDN